jgi:hypothetical protein
VNAGRAPQRCLGARRAHREVGDKVGRCKGQGEALPTGGMEQQNSIENKAPWRQEQLPGRGDSCIGGERMGARDS